MKLHNVICLDCGGLPCQKCGGYGYILTYDHTHPDAINTPISQAGGKSIIPCSNYKKVWVKPPKQDWDSIWMNLATAIASRSTCNVPDRSIGCVITSWDNTKVLAMGYNGSAKGDDNKCEYDPTVPDGSIDGHTCGCVHAEMNAMTKLGDYPFKKRMYITLAPCRLCYKLIRNGNISELVYKTEHRADVIQELERLGVQTRKYEDNRS